MIAVLADDFSGAAELAGISLRYGLMVELFVNELTKVKTGTDIVIVSTDSRSLKKEEAIAITEKVMGQLLALHPLWIYKKIDSVLRGYVLEELEVQMRLMDRSTAFIMPANPSLGRTIKDGKYFVNGIEIDKTGFANDPEFPVTTADVKRLLQDKVKVLKKEDDLSAGIIVGEAQQLKDYDYWAEKTDGIVIAGAADFYTTILKRQFKPVSLSEPELQRPFLYVCGTAFSERRAYIKTRNSVSWLPEKLTAEWIQQTGKLISHRQKVVIAIDEPFAAAVELREKMAAAVVQLLEKFPVKELFIEGGSTAAALLSTMRIDQLEPVNELNRGVVRMKAGELFITVKPGSYVLPGKVKNILND